MIARSRTIAESLLDRLLDAFPPERPYDRAAWTQDPMPGAVAQFLEHTLQRRLHQETTALRQACTSPWVDDEHPSVRRARQLLTSALEEHAQIPADAWPTMLGEAVRRVVAYLAEPRRTLVEHIFDDDPLPVTTVRQQMAAFVPYGYLHEGVEAYIRYDDPDTLTADQFDELLRRIDRHTTDGYDTDDWMRLLEPLYAIVTQANAEEAGVPVPLLGAFFSEKGYRRAVRQLREVHEQHQADQLSGEALRRLLDEPDPADTSTSDIPATVRSAPLPDDTESISSASASSATASAPAESSAAEAQSAPAEDRETSPSRPPAAARETAPLPDDPPAPATSSAEAEPPPTNTPPRPSDAPAQDEAPPSDDGPDRNEMPAPPDGAPGDAVPLWRQFQQGLQRAPATGERVMQRRGFHSTPDIEREEEATATTDDAPAPPSVPRWMQYHDPDEDDADEGHSLDVLERSVLGPSGPRNRELFLDELFEGDVDEYAATLQRLLSAPSWAEASKIIAEDVFRKHQVNIYSDPAVLFTDAAELRYRR